MYSYSHLCFFFNDTATTEIYTLSLHDALPISDVLRPAQPPRQGDLAEASAVAGLLLKDLFDVVAAERDHLAQQLTNPGARSEEHTSELQSRQYLVCRFLPEKKKLTIQHTIQYS